MRYEPNFTLNVIKDELFETQIKELENELAKYANFGEFASFDKTKIHYEYFLCENARGNIVIVHGLSEFTKKFYEFTYYALNLGYNVFIYDQRCHGLSDRLTNNVDILHVDNFNDYALDLEIFIEKIVIPTENKPIFLYAHSMGGAVSALYLNKYSDKIKKAVFSAPLFIPVVNNVSTFLARESVRLGKVLLGPKRRFFLSNDFDPDIKFNEKYGSSEPRFYHNINLRKQNIKYQSSPMSFGWVFNSLTVHHAILKKKFLNKIKTPILIFSAEKDNTVKNEPQYYFAKHCENCEIVNIENTTHAILASKTEMLEKVLKSTFDYFSN